jgi:hypothetical protein
LVAFFDISALAEPKVSMVNVTNTITSIGSHLGVSRFGTFLQWSCVSSVSILSQCKTIALSLCLTHNFKISCLPTKMTNVYQLDGEKTDLKKSCAFELEWVVQIQFIGQWSRHWRGEKVLSHNTVNTIQACLALAQQEISTHLFCPLSSRASVTLTYLREQSA